MSLRSGEPSQRGNEKNGHRARPGVARFDEAGTEEKNVSTGTLIEAVKAGDSQQVETALASGADVNAAGSEQEWPALNYAAGRGDLGLVERLVQAGADVFRTGRDKRTPYQIAVAAGHAAVARYLAKAEAAAGGDKERISSRQSETRPYCKAYHLKDLRRFGAWAQVQAGPEAVAGLSDESVVFVHQDLTVTQSMFHGEQVVLDRVTADWRAFCAKELGFKVPDDFDLMPPKTVADPPSGQ